MLLLNPDAFPVLPFPKHVQHHVLCHGKGPPDAWHVATACYLHSDLKAYYAANQNVPLDPKYSCNKASVNLNERKINLVWLIKLLIALLEF